MQILALGRNWDLVLFILLSVTLGYYLWRIRMNKPLPTIRRIPALDAIEDGVGRSVETGKMVFFEPGSAVLSGGPFVPMTLAAMNVLRYTSRLCAKRGAKFVYGTVGTEALPLAQGIIEESYKAEGKSEEYRPENIIYFGSGFSGNMAESSYMVTEGCASLVMVGVFYTSCLVVLGASARSGAIAIGGTARWIMMYAFGIAADYIFIMEDLYAASALVSGDPATTSTLAVEDVLKIFVLGLTIVGIVLVGLGVKFADLMKL